MAEKLKIIPLGGLELIGMNIGPDEIHIMKRSEV